jgi:hypothetical protein
LNGKRNDLQKFLAEKGNSGNDLLSGGFKKAKSLFSGK